MWEETQASTGTNKITGRARKLDTKSILKAPVGSNSLNKLSQSVEMDVPLPEIFCSNLLVNGQNVIQHLDPIYESKMLLRERH